MDGMDDDTHSARSARGELVEPEVNWTELDAGK